MLMPRFLIPTLALVFVTCALSLSAAEPVTLRVSLFPYVPDPKGIEAVVTKAWKGLHPNVTLEFVEWDCYSQDPPADLDVFEFDSVMLDYLVTNSFVTPLERSDIVDRRDLYPFALRGAMVDGVAYGIPRLTCTQMLFYRKGDSAIEKAASIKDVHKVVGDFPMGATKPADGKGLLIDLTGGTTCSCLYLEALADADKEFSFVPSLPKATEVTGAALDNVRLLTKMAGVAVATCEDCDRPGMFAAGKGQILVGYSERLAFMPKSSHEKIALRGLPLADQNTFNIFAVDVLGINSLIDENKREMAIDFVNLATSAGVVRDSLLVKQSKTGSPQYLLPARMSVMSDASLMSEAPLYASMKPLLETAPQTFRAGPEVRHWLGKNKKEIRALITAP